MRCRIGNVVFSFEGEARMAELIVGEFSDHIEDIDPKLRVDIKPVDDLNGISGDMTKSEKGRFYDTGYSVTLPKEKKQLSISIDKQVLSGGLIGKGAKIWDWNYLTPKEIVAKNLIYDVLEPLAHGITVKEGTGFIHASAIARGKECALFTGEGGVGKTAMCLIASSMGYDYLNDDLSLVDSEGICYHHPKRLQIYGYNLKDMQELKGRFFKGRGVMDRIQFVLRKIVFGPKKVRRRTPPKELFDRIKQSARISKIFYLARGDDLEIQKMEKGRFVESELNIIQKEFSDYLKGLEQRDKSELNNFLMETKKLYNSLFDSTECLLVSVPPTQNLKELFHFLEKGHPLSAQQ